MLKKCTNSLGSFRIILWNLKILFPSNSFLLKSMQNFSCDVIRTMLAVCLPTGYFNFFPFFHINNFFISKVQRTGHNKNRKVLYDKRKYVSDRPSVHVDNIDVEDMRSLSCRCCCSALVVNVVKSFHAAVFFFKGLLLLLPPSS